MDTLGAVGALWLVLVGWFLVTTARIESRRTSSDLPQAGGPEAGGAPVGAGSREEGAA